MKFSVLVVSYNAREDLKKTVQSILSQSYSDYEIVIKDGVSTDDSLKFLPQDERIRLYVEKDSGIYDAMNKAAEYATGEFVMYMNCGDEFYSDDVLEAIAKKNQK